MLSFWKIEKKGIYDFLGKESKTDKVKKYVQKFILPDKKEMLLTMNVNGKNEGPKRSSGSTHYFPITDKIEKNAKVKL